MQNIFTNFRNFLEIISVTDFHYGNDIPADYVFCLLDLILSDEAFVMVNLIKPSMPLCYVLLYIYS